MPPALLQKQHCTGAWRISHFLCENSKHPVFIRKAGASIVVFVTRATSEQFINWLLVLVRITPRAADAPKGNNRHVLDTWADGWILLKRPQSPHGEAPDWDWTNKCLKVNSSPALLHVPYTTSCIASEIISLVSGIGDKLKAPSLLITIMNPKIINVLCREIYNTETPQSWIVNKERYY